VTAAGAAGLAASAGPPLLEIRDLAIDFGPPEEPLPAVRGVDLTVRQGMTLGIVGESGSGKSLSMLSVVSLLPATARVTGSIKLEGREVRGTRICSSGCRSPTCSSATTCRSCGTWPTGSR